MRHILSPRLLAVAALLMVLGLCWSPNAGLWAACLFVPPAVLGILGGSSAYPGLGWIVGMNWLAIAADVLQADLNGWSAREGWLGPYNEEAILLSLCAVCAIGVGMRCGVTLGRWNLGTRLRTLSAQRRIGVDVGLSRLLACYVGALLVTQAASMAAASLPTLAQPLLAVTLLRYVAVYAIAATVFETNRGYLWLILVIGGEFLVGMTGFFASFLQPVFLLVIALVSSRYSMSSARPWLLLFAAVVVMLWTSLVWTVVKPDYRRVMGSLSLQERVTWLADAYLSPNIDYSDASARLLERIGYTELYARVLARLETGGITGGHDFYGAAVRHVLTPRVFFPDKPALDDTAITRALTHTWVGRDTSVGVGYVAQAHVDFGFPGLLLPMLAVGFLLGLAAEYFMTRPIPLIIRQAFVTAALFSAFAFAADIDKALGGLITGWLALALVMKFVYPLIAPSEPRASAVPVAAGASI